MHEWDKLFPVPITNDLHRQVRIAAAYSNMSMAAYARKALVEKITADLGCLPDAPRSAAEAQLTEVNRLRDSKPRRLNQQTEATE